MTPVPFSDSKKLKICILTLSYPSHETSLEASWLRQSVNRLAARGHEVVVAAPRQRELTSPTIDGVRVFRFRQASPSPHHDEEQEVPSTQAQFFAALCALPAMIGGALEFARWAGQERFDVIDVHSPHPHGLMALLPSWLSGTRIVATCHEAELASAQQTPWGKIFLGWFLRHADLCTSSSSCAASEVADLSGRSARIIPHRLTAGARLARGTRRRDPQTSATLLFSGHLSQRKGLLYLLKALPIVLKKRAVRLVITGNGSNRPEWERLVAQLQLTEAVTFLGHVDGQELGRLYQTCDIFVLPALFDEPEDTEGLGIVLVEALINARPVIASAVGGIVEMIKHKRTGLLVPERSETALARAILRLLEDRLLARQLGRAGRDFAVRHFDAECIAGQLESSFYQAIAPAPVSRPSLRGGPALAVQGAC